MKGFRRAALALALAGLGCRHVGALPADTLAELSRQPGAFVAGEVSGLASEAVLNRTDFVWALDFSPDSGRVAFSQLCAEAYELALWSLGPPPQRLAETAVNLLEWDVEGLAFSPEGSLVAVASRDGTVRLYEAATGALKASAATDEPLVSVSFHPSGRTLVTGSALGLLSVFSLPALSPLSEVRGHAGEVRALAFAPDGTLYSGGWDRRIATWTGAEVPRTGDRVRLRFERKEGFSNARGTVNGRVNLRFAFDAQLPENVLGTKAAAAAGLDVGRAGATRALATARGTFTVPVVPGQVLRFKWLELKDADFAICDACLPPGVDGVLGRPFHENWEVVPDEAAGELQLVAKAPVGSTSQGFAYSERAAFSFPWHVNDVTLDARGERLGVAFSEAKAERTRAVYEREKQGVEEPEAAGNSAALVDAKSGEVLRTWTHHAGVVSSAALSPDGRTLASGGWDRKLLVVDTQSGARKAEQRFGWSVRRVRFSADGRFVGVAAWTPQNPVGNHESDPSAAVFRLGYAAPQVVPRSSTRVGQSP